LLLYIHIPFCDSKCFYCSFNSFTHAYELKEKYINSLISQFISDVKKYHIKPNSFETVFIGGGTPSTISQKLFEKLFTTISPYLKNNIEITTEANPNSATYEWINGMKSLGVNRFSFGVQSFDNDKLKYLGRNHDKKIAIKAIENTNKLGIENISLDLIYNTIKDNHQLITNDLDIALGLPINHISLYSLTIEDNTKFGNIDEKNSENLELTKYIFEKTSSVLPQYEISNFGTYRSQHNLGYWQYKEYLGLGSGAVGYISHQRIYPIKDIKEYINNPNNYYIENISHEDEVFEKIFLGLRSCIGVEEELFTNKEKLTNLIKEEKVSIHNNRVFNNNYLLADEIALYLCE
jgi:oxygen-independent coproporphyrinogen-3 oxidase